MIKSLAVSRENHLKMLSNNDDLMLKFMFVGDSGVGKTSLLNRYILDVFKPEETRSSIVPDFQTKNVNLYSSDNKRIKIQIWDTVGHDQFKICALPYFKDVHMFMIVYDITRKNTFNSINEWIKRIKIHGEIYTQIVIIGNKCDNERNRVISYEEGEDLAQEMKCLFYETSACHNLNLDRIFLDCADICSRGIISSKSKKGMFNFFSSTPKQDVTSPVTSPTNKNKKNVKQRGNSTSCSTTANSKQTPPKSGRAEQVKRIQQELDFFYEFQSKSNENIEISGIRTTFRKNKFNGLYRPCRGFIVPKYIHVKNNTISLILYNSIWFLKIGQKTICKIKCNHQINCFPYFTKKENNLWYERVGIFLPIFRRMSQINCELSTNPIIRMNSDDTKGTGEFNNRVSLFLRPSLYTVNNVGTDLTDLDEFDIENTVSNDNDTQIRNISTIIKYQSNANLAGLNASLFLQYTIIKIALLELDYYHCMKELSTVNMNKIELLSTEKRDIMDLYTVLVSTTTMNTPNNSLIARSSNNGTVRGSSNQRSMHSSNSISGGSLSYTIRPTTTNSVTIQQQLQLQQQQRIQKESLKSVDDIHVQLNNTTSATEPFSQALATVTTATTNSNSNNNNDKIEVTRASSSPIFTTQFLPTVLTQSEKTPLVHDIMNTELLEINDNSTTSKQLICTALEALIIDCDVYYNSLLVSGAVPIDNTNDINVSEFETIIIDDRCTFSEPLHNIGLQKAPPTVVPVSVTNNNALYQANNMDVNNDNKSQANRRQSVKNSHLTACLLTCDQLHETFKVLLLNDMALVADRIEWIVPEKQQQSQPQPQQTQQTSAETTLAVTSADVVTSISTETSQNATISEATVTLKESTVIAPIVPSLVDVSVTIDDDYADEVMSNELLDCRDTFTVS